ncbi:MAG: DNA-3-methyladenine glycosylase I [Candidatus Polarisedimenticolia bacterium]
MPSARDRSCLPGPDGGPRCVWATGSPELLAYHDLEWGFPVTDDRRLFEKLSLEGFQCGLSWLTILRKREAFRRAFAGFDARRIARFTARDVNRLLSDAGIVRHRGKIEAVIGNARLVDELAEEFGSLSSYVWGFEPDPASRPRRLTMSVLRAMTTTEESRRLSADLKRRGWRFVGPTTTYAFMQAMGLVNDHMDGCVVRARVEAAPRPAASLSSRPRSSPRRHPR